MDDTFWYVQDCFYTVTEKNGVVVTHREFFSIPVKFSHRDDFNPERMFSSEAEANNCAFELTNSEGF